MIMRVEFDDSGVLLLKEIQRLTGLKTYAEVFNNALTAFDWAAKQSNQGRLIVGLDDTQNVYQALDLPALRPKMIVGSLKGQAA